MVINLLGKGAGKVDDISGDTDSTNTGSSESEQEDPQETMESVTAKIAEAIAKLAGGGATQVSNTKESPKDVKAAPVKAAPGAGTSGPAPKAQTSPTAEASSSGSTMSAASSSVAASKESKKNKSGVVPVPVPIASTTINNTGSAAPPTVVRARQPITTGI